MAEMAEKAILRGFQVFFRVFEQIFSLLHTLRRFKPLGISLKVNAGGETHVRFALLLLSYFSQIFTPSMTFVSCLL